MRDHCEEKRDEFLSWISKSKPHISAVGVCFKEAELGEQKPLPVKSFCEV